MGLQRKDLHIPMKDKIKVGITALIGMSKKMINLITLMNHIGRTNLKHKKITTHLNIKLVLQSEEPELKDLNTPIRIKWDQHQLRREYQM